MFEITFVFRGCMPDESFPQNPKYISKCNIVLMITDDDVFGMNYLIF